MFAQQEDNRKKLHRGRGEPGPAVANDRIVEIKSPLILQPGPAALTDGLDAIVEALWPEQVH